MAKRGKEQGKESAQGSWDSFFLPEVPCCCYKSTSTLELLAVPSVAGLKNKAYHVVCLPLAGSCSESVPCQMPCQPLHLGPTVSLLCLSLMSLRK